MSQFEYKQFSRRNLPHVQPPEATLFVTFRLAGSIPQTVLAEWLLEKKKFKAEQARQKAMLSPGTRQDPDEYEERKRQFQHRWFLKFENLLHEESTGPTWLKDERVAGIVAEALHYQDSRVYRLDAWCIMPNHVHAVFAPLLTEELARMLMKRRMARKALLQRKDLQRETQTDSLRNGDDDSVLSVIMHSLKGYTARKANLALGRSGSFWQHESFDHVIRSPEEWERTVSYVLNNPVKAGLGEKLAGVEMELAALFTLIDLQMLWSPFIFAR